MRKEYQIIKPNFWKRNYEIRTYEGWKMGDITWGSTLTYNAKFGNSGSGWSVKSNAWGVCIKVLDRRGMEIGQVKRNVWGNKTTFHYKGREYNFKKYHWASNIFMWEDMGGRKLMSFKGNYYGKNKVGTMRVYGELDAEFMSLMGYLGWYMVAFLQIQQSAAVA